jgi:hypothetical protein
MSNLTVFGSANLPSAASLADSLRSIKTGVSDAGVNVILKMDKTGQSR